MVLKNLLLALLVFVFTACSHSPYTGRKQLIMVSPAQEMQMGLQAERQIMAHEKISQDPRLNAMVREVGSRIARAANQPNYQWEFHVIDSPQVNAFCLPGGKIFVYTGLFKVVKNENDLAIVLGHEVAHAIARHGAERVSMMQLGELAKRVAIHAAGAKYQNMINQAYGIGANYGVFLPYSRKFEYEADEIGLYLAAKAGYDPRDAISFWDRMRRMSQSMRKPPEFASTHPSDSHRIQRLRAIMPKAVAIYNQHAR